HFAGRRSRYVPPLRLYVFSGLVFFGVMAVTGGGPFRFAVAGSADGRSISFGVGRIGTTVEESGDGAETVEPAGPVGTVSLWLDERLARVSRNPEAYNAATLEALSYVHFLALPIFALLTMAFWRGRYYVEHLVFAMHVHALLLLLAAAVVVFYAVLGVGPEDLAARVLGGIGWGLAAAYLFFAFRRAYGGRWWATAIKLAVFGWLYMLAAGLVLSAVAFATILMF
ncbi:MAG TPA: hypothetical protein VM778_09730, partial [Gemmatimonadota bacterium]|nr:hypothetical protein [Gemmatimonadota bacterium]